MRKPLLLILLAALALPGFAETRDVQLSSVSAGGTRNEIPAATYNNSNCELRIAFAAIDSCYWVTVTNQEGEDATVTSTSQQVTIPLSGVHDCYVVTVRTSTGNVFDGVISRSGATTATLSNRQALRLVKNRRAASSGVDFYAATVSSVVDDPLRCPVTTAPTQAWANDASAEKWLIFTDEMPECGWAHPCTYTYIPKSVSTSDSISTVTYEGVLPPADLTLTALEANAQPATTAFKRLPQNVVSARFQLTYN